eukprot:TRINITY_DN33360_c0_g1_i1.p1 TRINITY_DN33360_c0_g1~~TRINITY_DN33360_c0_g1_i1.p1  ORF type:complete len:397 (+),score=69.88 TRINITY_DN33360_c0_g1_i1:146-1336(+)
MRYKNLPADEPLWPFMDEKRAVEVNTVEDFVQALMFEEHLDRVVVLHNGIDLMKQGNALPPGLNEAVMKSQRVCQVLDALPSDEADTMKGRLWQFNEKGTETEIKKADKVDTVTEIVEILREANADGSVDRNVPLYLSELRHNKKVEHPITGEMVKTVTTVDMYDVVAQRELAPLWERSEGGVFVGERGSGSGLHTDQCLWSNVGKQWYGYKLMAVWPWSERLSILEDAGRGAMFHFPLTPEEIGYLSRACVVTLIRPGDVFVFSGAQPHMAMCIGDNVNVTAYESMLPLNSHALATLSRTNSKDHFKKCWMDDDDLDELFEDVVDSLLGNLNDPSIDPETRNEICQCEEAMKQQGDSYVKRLWKREERRRKRARQHLNTERTAAIVTPVPKRTRK